MKANTKKKRTTAILSIVLVAVIAIGATLAYLATKTEEASNVFAFASNIKAKLTEPNWNPDEGENLTPGYEVKKDPMITNQSDNGVDEYVALQLTFTDGAGDALDATQTAKLLNCLDIKWNSNWSLQHGTLTTDGSGTVTAATPIQMYVYNAALSPGQVSDPVFSSVTIKSDISDADYEWLAAIIMNHTDDCFTFGIHLATDVSKCTITYKHHEKCALFDSDATGDPADIPEAAKGDTVGNKICNCIPAEQHNLLDPDVPCAALTATLITTGDGACTHTVPGDAINGFQIKVQGAAVQAGVENMTTWNASATITNLKGLFGL